MSEPAAAIRALNCPNCGGAVELRAAGYTVSLVCPHCGSTLDATDPDFKAISTAANALRRPEIALGTRGMLDGVDWEAVGYLERRASDGGWSEYLLFNPYHGYRFLVDDGRRFSLGQVLDRMPRDLGGTVVRDGEIYSLFGFVYFAQITFVVGEFYWRAKVGDRAQLRDYVRPGAMLSQEVLDEEESWTALAMLDYGVIEAAFAIPVRPRDFSAPAPHEPSPHLPWLKIALAVAGLAFLALGFISQFAGPRAGILLERTVAVVLDGPEQTIVLGPIELTRPRTSLTVAASVPSLDNAWVDADYALVDRRTQESFDATATAEYYHGRDSDGSWSEGDAAPRTRFASIAAGSYDLVVTLQAHNWTGAIATFATSTGTVDARIVAWEGASFPGNFWIVAILLFVWPAILLARHLRFEQRRRAPGED